MLKEASTHTLTPPAVLRFCLADVLPPKSARKMNLPRINLLLRELEEMSGGVLLDCQGSSIWLYR